MSTCCFLGNDTKTYFLLIWSGAIIAKGFMNTANFEKTSLLVEQNYEQQTSTRL